MMRPNQVRSKPSVLASGKKIGAVSSIMDSWSMKQPRNRITPIMTNSMPSGVTLKPSAQFMSPLEAPVKASTCAKVAEPKMMRNAMTVTRSAPLSDLTKAFQVISP